MNAATREITTLGRGGSDTTAVAMAAALKAERCEIIKEVDGICSADPRIVPDAKPLRRVDFASLSEMCFWGAKILHFRSVELAQSQNVPLVLKRWGRAEHSTEVMNEVAGMENGRVLAVNAIARIEHVEVDSDLNHGFEKFAQHLRQSCLSWPQLLASGFAAGKTSMTVACDSEWLDALLRTLERSKGFADAPRGLELSERNLLRRRFVGIAVQGIEGSRTSRDCLRSVRAVAAFDQSVCPHGEPRGRGQGITLPCPAGIASRSARPGGRAPPSARAGIRCLRRRHT